MKIAIISMLLSLWVALFALVATGEKAPADAVVEEPPVEELVVEEVVVIAPVVVPAEPTVKLYDVPLSEELQLHIIRLCEEYGIDPTIVIAMIRYESSYNANAVGDGGASIGLMQIQPRWHYARMEKFGCTDLYDPFQNVTVGIDIIAGKLSSYETAGEALTAYNAGDYGAYEHYFSKGIYANGYAKKILAYAEELNKKG